MGERAHRQEVHAGLRHRPGRLQPQAAARLQPGPRVGRREAGRGAQPGQVHVVEQDELDPGREGLAHLVQAVALHLQRQAGRGGPDGPDRGADAARRGDVVVLDQRRVAQSHPVVGAAAAAHRVLVQRPQPRRGLPGVADGAVQPGDRVDPRPGGGGDPGQVGEEVQQGPLGGQDVPERGAQAQDLGARPDYRAVGAQRAARVRGYPRRVEHGKGDRQARDHAGLPGHHPGHGAGPGRRHGHRGQVRAVVQVLGQGVPHHSFGPGRLQPRVGQPPRHRRVQRHRRPPASASPVSASPASASSASASPASARPASASPASDATTWPSRTRSTECLPWPSEVAGRSRQR